MSAHLLHWFQIDLPWILALVSIGIMVYFDQRHRIIPNWLIIVTLLIGVVYHIWNHSLISLGYSALVISAITILLHYLRVFQPGDVKFIIALTFLLSWPMFVILSLLIGLSQLYALTAKILKLITKVDIPREQPLAIFLAISFLATVGIFGLIL